MDHQEKSDSDHRPSSLGVSEGFEGAPKASHYASEPRVRRWLDDDQKLPEGFDADAWEDVCDQALELCKQAWLRRQKQLAEM